MPHNKGMPYAESFNFRNRERPQCTFCEGTGETWLGSDYSGHKDCRHCGGTGAQPNPHRADESDAAFEAAHGHTHASGDREPEPAK